MTNNGAGGMDRPAAQLVSARFSCGVGWLINALLEMDVPVSVVREGWPLPTWTAGEGGFRISEPAHETLHQIFPALQRRRTFPFPPGPEVLSEHYIHQFARHAERPTVVYVRDPRDAIYSWYRRFHRDEMSLAEYLCKPAVYHEGEGETSWLDMPPPHVWAVYHLFWLAMAEHAPVLVTRYEDMKANPVRETRRALEHLGLERDEAQIQSALELSTFERTRAITTAAATGPGVTTPYAGRGRTNEWKETYTTAELALFDGPAGLAMQALGYKPSASVVEQPCLSELTYEAVLTAAPAARPVLLRAQADLHGGNPDAACRRLAQAIVADIADPAQDSALVAALTALHWTRAVFTDAAVTDPPARRVFGLFAALHLRFRDDPHFRLAQMQELARRRPDLPDAFDRWAVALYRLGRAGEAAEVLARGCAGGADSALLRSNLAALHWEAGRHAQAFEQIGRGVILDPDHPTLRQNMAAVRAALGHTETAKAA